MTEQQTAAPVEAAQPTTTPAQPTTSTPPTEPADQTDWKAEARKWEQRAKDNHAARQELEKSQRAAMTDAERQMKEAEDRGRTAATSAFGERLARAEFQAAAARRNPSYDAAAVLDDLNLGKYVGDDGEPDSKSIAKAVERLVPASSDPTPPSYDGGARTAAPKGADFNQILRRAAGRA